jgi:membrane-associated protease RseP (regulator of RpoE activity)
MNANRSTYAGVIVIAVVVALLCTCMGALAGGFFGYWLGQRATTNWAPELPGWEPVPEPAPAPTLPQRVPTVPRLSGALITRVVEGSPAEQAGITAGDIIVAIDGAAIGADDTLAQIMRGHRPGDTVEIQLSSRGQERTVQVKLGANPDDSNIAYLGVYYTLTVVPQRQTD